MLLLVAGYLLVVYYGPRVMRDRKPLEMKPLMIVYNFLLVLLSLYMALEVGKQNSCLAKWERDNPTMIANKELVMISIVFSNAAVFLCESSELQLQV